MQSPKVDWLAFDDEVTISESKPGGGGKLHKYTLEPVFWQWRYFIGLDRLL
jgi:hypothetical protein